jgi:malate dehydrogenase (oxaloacetate-decarboxylating)(NADP+)
MMLKEGDVDSVISGVSMPYAQAIKPLLQVIGVKPNDTLCGVYCLPLEDRKIFLADSTVNINPDAKTLADIACTTARLAQHYTSDPIEVAMLSFGSYGSVQHPQTKKIAEAVQIVKQRNPNFTIDGEIQADAALDPKIREMEFPFSELTGKANVLIFPDLNSANISYKLLSKIANINPIGPILAGLNHSACIMQRGASVNEIINMIYISAHQSFDLPPKLEL